MQTICQCLGVGIELLVKAHGVPTILSPVLPVLHNNIHRHLFLAEAVGGLQNLIRRMETLTTMDIAQCPTGHQGCIARQMTIGSDDFIGCSNKHGIVNSLGYRRAEHRLVLHLIIIQYRMITSRQFGLHHMMTSLQTHDCRGCRWQPRILHLYDSLTIDSKVMTTSHLLTYIEQQRIIAILGKVDTGLKDITLTHLTASALRRCNIYHLSATFSRLS